MGRLHDTFEGALREAPYSLATDLIARRLAETGVELRPREKERLTAHLQSGTLDSFEFRQWQWWRKDDLTVTISDEEAQALADRLSDFLENDLQDVILTVTDEVSAEITATLNDTWGRELRRRNKEIRSFERRLEHLWGSAIDRLRMCIAAASQLGESEADALRERIGDGSPNLLGVLVRLHARSCQIAQEVAVLLSAGFADGAMARWRTMHEVAAVAYLLAERGEALAERYVEHEAIESYRAAKVYRSCFERLGYEPMDDSEFQTVRQARDAALQRYGRDFDSQYGWAALALGKKRPSLRDIEEAARIDHFRAHYKMASHNVHANPKGVFFKLGLMDKQEVLLAGPSNAGLSDPGQSTAISLLQITSALCTLQPDLDSIVGQKVLVRLTDEAVEAFASAHDSLVDGVG